MLERFRFWVANAICPPVHVVVRWRGRQHFEKGVKLQPKIPVVLRSQVSVAVDDDNPPDIPLAGVGDMSATQVQKMIDESSVALTDEEQEARAKELGGYQGQNYAGMTGEDAAARDDVFRRANALRGAKPIDPAVIARLRGNLQDEGKLPE